MKKQLFAIAVLAISLVSCGTNKMVLIPRAVNTMNTTGLSDLRLTANDYEIFNTVTTEATITYQEKSKGDKVIIEGENGEFKLTYERDKKGNWTCKHQGIMRFGFFGNDYAGQNFSFEQPESIVRRLAMYKAIGLAKEYGADTMVEPTIATNIAQEGNIVVYKSTVVAKLLKIKSHN